METLNTIVAVGLTYILRSKVVFCILGLLHISCLLVYNSDLDVTLIKL